MAKSGKQKKKAQAKASAKRAEAQRLRDRAEREREDRERLARLLDPSAGPAEVAELLEAAGMTELMTAGSVARMRADADVPPGELAETARILLAEDPSGDAKELAGQTQAPDGTLAFAAISAHLNGDEDAEQRHTDELLSRLDKTGQFLARQEFARTIAIVGHPGRAAELVEPWLRDHPDDKEAGIVYAAALRRANSTEEPGEAENAALDRFADSSGLHEVREAVAEFLDRTEWGAAVTAAVEKAVELEPGDLESLSPAEVKSLSDLAFEIAVWNTETHDHDEHDHHEHGHVTPLTEFAADPGTPPELAKRASDWAVHAHYGLWLLEMPPDPGTWGTDLVTGTRRYIHFPDGALGAGAPRTVWLGGIWPVDGVWRSTGTGVGLSPDEGDALAEFAAQSMQTMLMRLVGLDEDEIPGPDPVPFDEPDPRGVRLELELSDEDDEDDEHSDGYDRVASTVVSVLAPELARKAYWYRADGARTDGAAAAGVTADWLDRPQARLDGLTPWEAADGDTVDRIYLEAALRQFEYQAGLAIFAGEKAPDTGSLRAELGLDTDFPL